MFLKHYCQFSSTSLLLLSLCSKIWAILTLLIIHVLLSISESKKKKKYWSNGNWNVIHQLNDITALLKFVINHKELALSIQLFEWLQRGNNFYEAKLFINSFISMFLFSDSKWIIVVSFVLGMFWPCYASLILRCPVNLGSICLGDSIKIIDKASLVAGEK